LSELTALEAGSYALGALEEALLSAVTTTVVGLEFAQGGPPRQDLCGGEPISKAYDDRDGSGTLTEGDTVRFHHAECFGLARNYALTLSAFNPSGGAYGGRLELTTSLGELRISGGFTLSLTVDATQISVRVSSAALTMTSAGPAQTVRVATSDFAVTQTSYSWSITGGNVDSGALGGSFAFATSGALSGQLGRLPSSGALLLSTPSGSRVSITPPTAPALGEATVDYAVAAPGGAYMPARQGLWTAMVRGWLFQWAPNSPPTISNLTLQPTLPAAGQPLSVYFDAADPDGDRLTVLVYWRRNGEPVGGNSTTFPSVTARNDVIEVTVSVSDGREQTPTRQSASVTIGNRAPVISSFSITPAQPDTTDDLVVVADVFDPDDDTLEASYVWYRNQTVVEGQTGPVFPASLTTRGDSFVVTATFRDDGLSVAGSASVAIRDAAPRVTVGAPPTAVTYGMPTTFTAAVSDPDGDPIDQLRFELAHGPAGMTVDPVTGAVAWTPSGPMFDRTLDVNWAVTVGILGARAATGTTRVEDPTRAYPVLRTGVQSPLRDSLRIDDFDADGDTEMLLLGTRVLLEVEFDGAEGYREAWAYPFAFDPEDVISNYSTRTLVTGDVDGDGRHEIFVSTDRSLVKLDGDERRVVASVILAEYERCTDLEYGDLDRNGSPEIVCAMLQSGSVDRLVIYDAADLSERIVLSRAPYGDRLKLGNVDSDPALEIVTSGGYVIDGVSTHAEWQFAQSFAAVATGNIDGIGPDEIIAQTSFTELAAFSAGSDQPLFTTTNVFPDALHVADIDGDSRAEILSGDNQWGNVTAYRYDTATRAADVVFRLDSQNHGVTAFGVGNLDGDAPLEIVWGTGLTTGASQLVVAEYPGNIEWLTADPERLIGPFAGGALARSPAAAPAPLFVSPTVEERSPLGSRIVRLDPYDGTLELSVQLDETHLSQFSTLTVADYDADGTYEALIASDGLFTAPPTAYDFYMGTSEWTAQTQSARKLTSGNVYGDARAELVWAGEEGVVFVLDVATQQLIWQSEPLEGEVTVQLADLDGDGYAEIVASTFWAIVTFERSPLQPFQMGAAFRSSLPIDDVAVGDTDGDGTGEIFALIDRTSEPWSSPASVVRFDDRLRPQQDFSLPWYARSLAIEASPFARKNLLVSYIQGASGRLGTVDARTGGIVSESPPLLGAVTRDSIHYVELGQEPARLSIGTEFGMYLTR
jgi:hypothetical protein